MTKRIHVFYTTVLLAGFLTAGCDTIDRTQIRIGPGQSSGAKPTAVTAADKEAIRAALQPIAAQLKLQDITAQSLIPNLIVHFQQLDVTGPIKLIAWEDNGAVLVDLMQGESSPGLTGAYQGARDRLIEVLRTQFGERAKLVPFHREAEQRRRIAPEQ